MELFFFMNIIFFLSFHGFSIPLIFMQLIQMKKIKIKQHI